MRSLVCGLVVLVGEFSSIRPGAARGLDEGYAKAVRESADPAQSRRPDGIVRGIEGTEAEGFS